MEYPIGYSDVCRVEMLGEIVGVMEYDSEFVVINFDAKFKKFGTKKFIHFLRF